MSKQQIFLALLLFIVLSIYYMQLCGYHSTKKERIKRPNCVKNVTYL